MCRDEVYVSYMGGQWESIIMVEVCEKKGSKRSAQGSGRPMTAPTGVIVRAKKELEKCISYGTALPDIA